MNIDSLAGFRCLAVYAQFKQTKDTDRWGGLLHWGISGVEWNWNSQLSTQLQTVTLHVLYTCTAWTEFCTVQKVLLAVLKSVKVTSNTVQINTWKQLDDCIVWSKLKYIHNRQIKNTRTNMWMNENTHRSTSSSRMRVIYHNWSAMKQRPHPQSVAEISHHSVLSGGRIRQCETWSGSRHKDTDKSPFPSAGTAVSLFRAKTVQQRPLLPREVETWLPDCGVTH